MVPRDEILAACTEGAKAHIDSVADMFTAPLCVSMGLRPVSIGTDRVVMSMEVRPEMLNSNGYVHGGAIYGLIDHTFAVLTNVEGHAVGQSSNVQYYRPGRNGTMTATATFINASRSLYTVDVRVEQNGKLIASAVCVAFRLQEVIPPKN